MGPIAQFNPSLLDMNIQNGKVMWIDEKTQGRVMLAQEGDPEQDLCIKTKIDKVVSHRKVNPKSLRCAIKVSSCSQ